MAEEATEDRKGGEGSMSSRNSSTLSQASPLNPDKSKTQDRMNKWVTRLQSPRKTPREPTDNSATRENTTATMAAKATAAAAVIVTAYDKERAEDDKVEMKKKRGRQG